MDRLLVFVPKGRREDRGVGAKNWGWRVADLLVARVEVRTVGDPRDKKSITVIIL